MTDKYEDDLQKAIQMSLLNYNESNEEDLINKAIKESLNEYSINELVNKDTVSANDHLMKHVLKKLNSFQKDIFSECIIKGSGGLSLPLGSGKTLISLALSLYFTRETVKPVLVVVSKSLIGNWEIEIKKFFGDNNGFDL